MTSQKQAELEADIARQREELAATVNELTEQVQARARTTAKQAVVAAGVAAVVVAGLVVVRIVRRRRS
jgi:F0F1-type ATP synthase assembly protein I